MRVVGLMSGSGTNLIKILEHEKGLRTSRGVPPFAVVAIFCDRWKSNALRIGRDYNLPVVTRDIKGFYDATQKLRDDMEARREFDYGTVKALEPYEATVR